MTSQVNGGVNGELIEHVAPPTGLPPSNACTRYEVIGEPFSDAGASQVTLAWVSPRTAVTFCGAPGTPAGVTGAEAVDGSLSPTALVATTVNVYAVPFVNPVTSQVNGGVNGEPIVHVAPPTGLPPSNACTAYEVIGEPLSEVGASQVTLAWASPATAVTVTGASGTPAGVTDPEGSDGSLVPTSLVAVTVKVYAVPLATP